MGTARITLLLLYGKWYYRAISKLKCTDYWVLNPCSSGGSNSNMDKMKKKKRKKNRNWNIQLKSTRCKWFWIKTFDVCTKCVELVVLLFSIYIFLFCLLLYFFFFLDPLRKVFASQTNRWTVSKKFRVPDENHHLLIRAVCRSSVISHNMYYSFESVISGGTHTICWWCVSVTECPNFRISVAMLATESNLEN